MGLVGLSAILVAYVPALTNLVGIQGVQIASLIAAISLVGRSRYRLCGHPPVNNKIPKNIERRECVLMYEL